MSNQLLKSLPLGHQMIEKLQNVSLLKIDDLISKSPIQLVKMLNLPLSRVESLLKSVLDSIQIEPITVSFFIL
jgi:hypothetical protein